MTHNTYVIIGVIILGWAVAHLISYYNRKQTERNNLISNKNNLLADVLEQSFLCWNTEESTRAGTAEHLEIVWKIERIRKIYKELEGMGGDDSYKSKIKNLRKVILDIENIADYQAEKVEAKRDEIEKIIEDLESFPSKKF